MTVVCLAAPIRWNRAALNIGEVVSLPDDLATQLVSSGQAHRVDLAAKAADRPPVDKLMRPDRRKSTNPGSRPA